MYAALCNTVSQSNPSRHPQRHAIAKRNAQPNANTVAIRRTHRSRNVSTHRHAHHDANAYRYAQ